MVPVRTVPGEMFPQLLGINSVFREDQYNYKL